MRGVRIASVMQSPSLKKLLRQVETAASNGCVQAVLKYSPTSQQVTVQVTDQWQQVQMHCLVAATSEL